MRKGLSPFIATVLLVGFTLSIGVILSNWVLPLLRSQTDDISTKAEDAITCSGAKLFFEKSSFAANTTRLSLVAENRGNVNMTDLKIYVTMNNDTFFSYTEATNYNTVLLPSQRVQLSNSSGLNKSNVKFVDLVAGPNSLCPAVKWRVQYP